MKLLTLENSKVVRYDASYNRDEMIDFLKTIINSYGTFRRLDLKANNEKKLLFYCDEYRDLNILKTYEDNRMVHKGRKRIPKKIPLRNYLYSFTAVDHPEILYTIVNFLTQKEMDFSMFSKYLNADINVNYNDFDYYIEEGYMGYKEDAIPQLKLSLNSDDLKMKYIDKVIERRLLQSECLKDFYKLFALEKIDDEVFTNTELSYLYGTTSFDINRISGLLNSETISKLLGWIINNKVIPAPVKPKEMEQAQRNSDIIEKIENHISIKLVYIGNSK